MRKKEKKQRIQRRRKILASRDLIVMRRFLLLNGGRLNIEHYKRNLAYYITFGQLMMATCLCTISSISIISGRQLYIAKLRQPNNWICLQQRFYVGIGKFRTADSFILKSFMSQNVCIFKFLTAGLLPSLITQKKQGVSSGGGGLAKCHCDKCTVHPCPRRPGTKSSRLDERRFALQQPPMQNLGACNICTICSCVLFLSLFCMPPFCPVPID